MFLDMQEQNLFGPNETTQVLSWPWRAHEEHGDKGALILPEKHVLRGFLAGFVT